MDIGTRLVQGVIGGAAGAGCMSAVRMAARRFGAIDATPPQATKDWLAGRVGVKPDGPATSHLMDSLIHLAIGVGGGAVYGGLLLRGPRPPLAAGALFGLGLWAVAFGALMPALGVFRSPREGTWPETGVNAVSHLLYGAVMALVAGELRGQSHGYDAPLRQLRARVG
jgi:hypothetical protein